MLLSTSVPGTNVCTVAPASSFQHSRLKNLSSTRALALSCSTSSSSSTSYFEAPRSYILIRPIDGSFSRKVKAGAFAIEEAAEAIAETVDGAEKKEKLGVVVKPLEKPRLVLKFIWLEKNIGLALDQSIPGQGTVPISPYYFWPRKDAWEELKTLLESKPWISQKRMIILLNQATDIINLWQQSGGSL